MALKEDILKRIKDEESQALLISYVRTYRLKTAKQINGKLDYHLGKCQAFLATNRYNSSINARRREYTKKLEYFMQIKKIAGRLR